LGSSSKGRRPKPYIPYLYSSQSVLKTIHPKKARSNNGIISLPVGSRIILEENYLHQGEIFYPLYHHQHQGSNKKKEHPIK